MNTNQIFGFAALLLGTLVSGTTHAACSYNDPSVSLSIRSPGSNAGVVVGTARISASVTPGTSSGSSSSSSCNSFASTSSSIYIDNRYIGSGQVDYNTNQFADGTHIVRVDASDSNGGRASVQQRIDIRNNWIRGEIYNLSDYVALNPDVANAFGGNPDRTLSHWLQFGIREGRQANLFFSSREYAENNGDIAAAFGADWPRIVDHYIVFGINERRTTLFALRGEVYNVHDYYARHGDLQAAFPGDVVAVTRHWLQFGVNEGRRGVSNFSPATYMQRHGDLQNAFGATNYAAGIRHYLQYGLSEGRSGN